MASNVIIRIISGPATGGKYSIEDPMVIIIGRDDVCNLTIVGDDMISGRHFQFEINPPAISATDLSSTNGTFVNNENIGTNQPRPLANGDEIQAGNSIFSIEIQKEEIPVTPTSETIAEPPEPDAQPIDDVETFDQTSPEFPYSESPSHQVTELPSQSPAVLSEVEEQPESFTQDEPQNIAVEETVEKIDEGQPEVAAPPVIPESEIKPEQAEQPIEIPAVAVPMPEIPAPVIEGSAAGAVPNPPHFTAEIEPAPQTAEAVSDAAAIAESPNPQVIESLNPSITESPNHQIPESLNHRITESPNVLPDPPKEDIEKIIDGSYLPVEEQPLWEKGQFELFSFLLNSLFRVANWLHIFACKIFRIINAVTGFLVNRISWSTRFAFLLAILAGIAIRIGTDGDKIYIALAGFDQKQIELLESTGLLENYQVFAQLSLYVGCFMLLCLLMAYLRTRISLLFLKISGAAFGIITLWLLQFLIKLPFLMLEADTKGKLFDKFYRNQLWVDWVWMWVPVFLLTATFLVCLMLRRVKEYYKGKVPEAKTLIGDRIADDFKNNSKDPRFRTSLYWAGFAHIAVLFFPLLLIRGCMTDYEIPKGDGVPQKIVIKKIKPKEKKKEYIFNMNSAISFYVPKLDDERLKELDKDTEDQYKATSLVGKPTQKGGKPGWPNGMENARVRFIRLKYSGGDWDQNMGKGADYNFLIKFNELTKFKIADSTEAIEISDLRRFRKKKAPPFVYITGKGNINVTQKDINTLRWYLTEQGGMLFADNGGGNFNNSIRSLIRRIFPQEKLIDIANDDIIYQTPYYFPDGAPPLFHHSGNRALGINYNGRWAVFYHQGDINDAWQTGGSGVKPAVQSQAFKMGINVVNYAFNSYMNMHYGNGKEEE